MPIHLLRLCSYRQCGELDMKSVDLGKKSSLLSTNAQTNQDGQKRQVILGYDCK